MRTRVALYVLAVLAVAGPVRGASIGVYEDLEGTDCDLTVVQGQPSTWYLIYRPSAGEEPLSSITVSAVLDGFYYTGIATPHPDAFVSFGNPLGGSGTLFFGCPGVPGPQIVLYTFTVSLNHPGGAQPINVGASVTPCNRPSFQLAGNSVVNMFPQPPAIPSVLTPADQAVLPAPPTQLLWIDDPVSSACLTWSRVADVYFGVDPNPPLVARIAQPFYTLPPLSYETTYYWRIDCILLPNDVHASGPVWSFRIGQPPNRCDTVCFPGSLCPSGCMTLSGVNFCVPEAKAEHRATLSCASPSTSEAFGAIDLASGIARSRVDRCFESANSANVTAIDRFHLIGPPSATPISFVARLQCTDLEGGSQSCLRVASSEQCGFGASVQLPLQRLVSEEFTLEYTADSGSNTFGGGARTAQLLFDLPAGYSITSCHGYGSPVAVQEKSWSRLKAIYR